MGVIVREEDNDNFVFKTFGELVLLISSRDGLIKNSGVLI